MIVTTTTSVIITVAICGIIPLILLIFFKRWIKYRIAILMVAGKSFWGTQLPPLSWELRQPLPKPNSNDSFYFSGFSIKKNKNEASDNKEEQPTIQFFSRMGFRNNKPNEKIIDKNSADNEYVEGWLLISISNTSTQKGGILRFCDNHIKPESSFSDMKQSKQLKANPFNWQCVEPLKKWRLSFKSDKCTFFPFNDDDENSKTSTNISMTNKQVVEAQLEVVYVSDTNIRSGSNIPYSVSSTSIKTRNPVFNFKTDLDASPIASSMADESWSLKYFRELKATYQNHFEQWGAIKGYLTIMLQDKTFLKVTIDDLWGMRDRSFGVRDWGYLNRWVLLFGRLDNGTAFHVTWVDHPLSHSIVVGYHYTPGDTAGNGKEKFTPVRDCNLQQLCQFKPSKQTVNTEDTLLPQTLDFNMTLVDGNKISGTMTVRRRPCFDMGSGVLFEQLVDFEVQGAKGAGIAEFAFNNQYRPESFSDENLY